MKKLMTIMLLALVCTAALAMTPEKQTASIAAGAVTLSNSTDYVVKRIAQVSVSGVTPVDSTSTLYAVQDQMTNAIATVITLVNGAASVTLTNTVPFYLFKGGVITGTVGTNVGTLRVIFEHYP